MFEDGKDNASGVGKGSVFSSGSSRFIITALRADDKSRMWTLDGTGARGRVVTVASRSTEPSHVPSLHPSAFLDST